MNSSTSGSPTGQMNNTSCCSSNSIASLGPGGVVTTQNISTVIKPKENNNSMQFVKIQTPELSKKAVEQIRVAEESKISKDKIKEVEEEWQSNLLNWKSKRRQQFVGVHTNDPNEDEQNNNQNDANENGRKIKTFAEMIEQRAKTGNRLNFHLERYIGSSESDNQEEEQDNLEDDTTSTSQHVVDKKIAQLSLNNNNNNSNKHHQFDTSTMDDHSNQRHPPSAPATLKDIIVSNDTNSNSNSTTIHNGRNGFSQVNRSSGDENNVALSPVSHKEMVATDVDYDEADDGDDEDADERRPINSTFIKGVDHPPTPPPPPPMQSDDRIRPMLEVDTRTNEVSSAHNRFEDNGSDHEEEEDEQEEEQKHLQRIAFVAKLKAFEKMTQPTLQEPRFVPPKTVKAPPLAPSRPSHAHQHQPPPPPSPPPSSPPPTQSRASAALTQPIPEPSPYVVKQPPKPRPQPVPPQPQVEMTPAPEPMQNLPSPMLSLATVKPTQTKLHKPIPTGQVPIAPPKQLKANHQQVLSPIAPPNVQQQQQLEPKPRAVQAPPQQSSPPSRKQPASPSPQSPIPNIASISHQPKEQYPRSPPQVSPPMISPQQPMTKVCDTPALPSPTPSQPPAPPPQTPQRQQNSQRQPQQQQQAPTRQQSHQQQQPQQSPPQPSLKDDKSQDRTVLSVSGKKRCSSCKEELGRGAAAFVIESLNLVYHTNCFRCSVCHVNLSNGFRGVDVRVHAGALHCQNCYSKDGLNYSRV